VSAEKYIAVWLTYCCSKKENMPLVYEEAVLWITRFKMSNLQVLALLL
jgi:hypothetical protein